MAIQLRGHEELSFDPYFIEQIILDLSDCFNIRIEWNKKTAILTGAMAVAGGLIGGYAGGRMAVALGAGIGGATGIGVAAYVSFREIWTTVKENLKELIFIVFNYLRRLDTSDYIRAIDILISCGTSRRDLVYTIIDFISEELGRKVLSSLTAA